jgi:Protein of unknown function (DUF2933)
MRDFIQSRTGIMLIGFLAVAAFFLVVEHQGHLLGVLPYALLLLCPLLHLTMHGGTGNYGGQADGGAHQAHEGPPNRRSQ